MAEDFVATVLNGLSDVLNQSSFGTLAQLSLWNLLLAALIFVVGWIIAIIVSSAFRKFLDFVSLEKFLEVHKIEDSLGKVQVSLVLAKIVKYYIILVFIQAALDKLGLPTVTDFISELLVFSPKIIGGILVILLSAIVGELLREKILALHAKEDYIKFLGQASKYILIYVGVTIALGTVGFPTVILDSTFITVVQALAYGAGLALAISFGLAGQETAKDIIKDTRKKLGY